MKYFFFFFATFFINSEKIYAVQSNLIKEILQKTEDYNFNTLGEAITHFINDAGMNQSDLAARLYIHYSTLSKWVKNRREMPLYFAQKIANVLQKPVAAVVFAQIILNREIQQAKIDFNIFLNLKQTSRNLENSTEHTFGQLVRDCRKDVGISQRELSKRLNHRTYSTVVSRIELHAYAGDLDTVQRIAKFFNKPLELFLKAFFEYRLANAGIPCHVILIPKSNP